MSKNSTPSSRIGKVVIPAAGMGRRLLPATKVIPKEMLPVGGRPLIQIAVEEAVASGAQTVILVIGRGKNLLRQHFHRDHRMENSFRGQGYEDDAELLRHLANLAEIRTAWQDVPLGLADAIRCARSLVGDEPFAVLLPDAIIDAEEPCVAQLWNCYQRHRGCVVATRVVKPREVERFGILNLIPMRDQCCGGRVSRVSSLTERPRKGTTTSRHGIFGRYILEPTVFDAIEQTRPGFAGELQLTDALLVAASSTPIFAYRFAGEHYDAGSKLGFLQANVAYAMKDPAVAPALLEYLAALQLSGEGFQRDSAQSA